MLTSHKLLQQFWHDDRYDSARVKVWYSDRGALHDRSLVSGPDISLEPYYRRIRTPEGMKPIPYHRILLITYDGMVEFENRKIEGEVYTLIEEIMGKGIIARDNEKKIENENYGASLPSDITLVTVQDYLWLIKISMPVVSIISEDETGPLCKHL